MSTYYDDMSESAALNYLAGTTDFGDASAIRRIAAYIDAATGSGSPEGAVSGNVGDLFTDYTNGHLYIKASGTGNTGWVQLESATSGSGDVNGPGSATDNALVRFDGTGGKTVQNSGITVDDSGYITSALVVTGGDVVVSKSGATLSVNASSSAAYINVRSVAGQYAAIYYKNSDNTARWFAGKSNSAESGSNAGSDYVVQAYSDAGSFLFAPLAITRSTGKVNLGSVGATAGLELGPSGPRIMSGTGSPEGVVTAPVGSQWIDTSATTGAIKWIKASGTGNTGWVVEYGDTGWRNVATLASATTITYGVLRLRRSRDHVTLHVTASNSVTTATTIFAAGVIPVGFRPNTTFTTAGGRDGLTSWPSPHQAALEITSGGGATFRANNAETAYLMAQWSTSDAWPSSLPGSAA